MSSDYIPEVPTGNRAERRRKAREAAKAVAHKTNNRKWAKAKGNLSYLVKVMGVKQ